jgi:hypothetical protein
VTDCGMDFFVGMMCVVSVEAIAAEPVSHSVLDA